METSLGQRDRSKLTEYLDRSATSNAASKSEEQNATLQMPVIERPAAFPPILKSTPS